MAIVNLSLDTATRQVILTINGVLVTPSDVLMEKYIFDGEESVSFHYTVESVDTNGMKERHDNSFFLRQKNLLP